MPADKPIFLLAPSEAIAAVIISRVVDDLRTLRKSWRHLPPEEQKRMTSWWLEHASTTIAQFTQQEPSA